MNELRLKLETTLTVIVATAVLWNLSIRRDEPHVDGPDIAEVPGDENPLNVERNTTGFLRRSNLVMQHFTV